MLPVSASSNKGALAKSLATTKRSCFCPCFLWAMAALSVYIASTTLGSGDLCGLLQMGKDPILVVDLEENETKDFAHLQAPALPEGPKYACNSLREEKFSRRLGYDQHRFLAILHLNEQLTKAKLHLMDIVYWARQLRRTLVLPNVGCSSISRSKPFPYCTYFDTQKLGDIVDWVTEEHFEEMTKEKNVSMLHLYLKYKNEGPCKLPNMLLNEKAFGESQLECMNSSHARPGDYHSLFVRTGRENNPNETMCVGTEDLRGNWSATDARINGALLNYSAHNVDVLMVTKFAVYPIIPKNIQDEVEAGVQYAPQLIKAADQISQRLGPRYAAVQWRTEKCLLAAGCTIEVFEKCAKSLVATVQRLKNETGAGVFFASDISAKGVALSTTIGGGFAEKRVRASTIVQEAYEAMQPVTWADIDPASHELDVGIQGILDKVACARAERFIKAPRECALQHSSYTQEIVELRKGWGKEQIEESWNFEETSPIKQETL